jgi:hypothetical protein
MNHNEQHHNLNDSKEHEHNDEKSMLDTECHVPHEKNINETSLTDRQRQAWVRYMHEKEIEGRTLFHLVLTYKTFEGRDHTEQDANKNFINFYTKAFLPLLLATQNYHRPQKQAVQPICLAFLDEHVPKIIENTSKVGSYDCRFVDRLHHHAILAVHPDNVDVMRGLDRSDLIKSSSFNSVMTMFYRECEPECLLYASKMMKKYPDYLTFPSLSRHREPIQAQVPTPYQQGI